MMTEPNKLAALTFDDGPNTTTTPQMLDKLAKHGVTASFFLVGDNITEQSAAVVRRAFEMGCEIGCHGKTHSAMPNLTDDEVKAEIRFTNDKITQITGTPPQFFRPPYIAVGGGMYESIDMTFVAGIGAEDWLDEVSADMRAKRILSKVRDGSIILLHDMSGNYRTADALDIIIPSLKRQGYELVTVSELFKRKNIVPIRGRVYSNVFQETEY